MSEPGVFAHAATMMSGTVTCDCGWTSGHKALGVDALEAYEQHLRDLPHVGDDTEVVFRWKEDES